MSLAREVLDIMSEQLHLIPRENVWELPQDYEPVVPLGFDVRQIFLCRGSLSTPERDGFVRRICCSFPAAKIVEQLDTAHNRVELCEPEPAHRVARGKQTLVFGELSPKHAVWDGGGREAPCLHRRRLSLCGFCFYACRFCYLAGRDAVWHSPTVKIFVNLTEIMDEAERHIRSAEQPLEFCIGELQDGLSLDPLTAYSSVLVPFFAKQRDACLEVRTKSTAVERLLPLNHDQRILLSWTLNPPEVARLFEVGAPPVEERVAAMRRCAQAGYRLRVSLMPVIPLGDWKRRYLDFVENLLEQIPVERLVLGGISMDERTRHLLELRMGTENVISAHLRECSDGQWHYSPALCRDLFQRIRRLSKRVQPDIEVEVVIP